MRTGANDSGEYNGEDLQFVVAVGPSEAFGQIEHARACEAVDGFHDWFRAVLLLQHHVNTPGALDVFKTFQFVIGCRYDRTRARLLSQSRAHRLEELLGGLAEKFHGTAIAFRSLPLVDQTRVEGPGPLLCQQAELLFKSGVGQLCMPY
jgi:hypothetical protein